MELFLDYENIMIQNKITTLLFCFCPFSLANTIYRFSLDFFTLNCQPIIMRRFIYEILSNGAFELRENPSNILNYHCCTKNQQILNIQYLLIIFRLQISHKNAIGSIECSRFLAIREPLDLKKKPSS